MQWGPEGRTPGPMIEPMKPEDLGGTSGDEVSVEIPVVETVGWVKRFLAWWRSGKKSEPMPESPSWWEQRQRENDRKANDAIAAACGETENQRRLRERG